jgi:osmotically-inducible protein OsmY
MTNVSRDACPHHSGTQLLRFSLRTDSPNTLLMKTDEQLRKDVMDEIRWDPLLNDGASKIGVAAHEGVVTLSGQVDSYSMKLAAERAAQRVMGVKVLAVDVLVNIPKGMGRSDTDIAEAIERALKWHSLVNEEQIKIKVEDGWVTLEGTAEWDYQKKAAQVAVQELTGVRGITNKIAIRLRSTDIKDIKRKIAAAFHRHATIDSSGIAVDVNGSTATLRGKVRSWAEKHDAEDAVWAAPGILSVKNQIEIDTELFVV